MIADATLERVLPRHVVALVGDLVRGLLWGGVVLLWVVFAQIYARMWRLTLADPANSDFTIFYYTARLVADGLPMYGASPERYGIHWAADHLGNLNPPHFQLLVQPLALLSYREAFVAWTSASAFALLLSCVVIVRELGIGVTWRRVASWTALIGSSAPFTIVAVTSELTFLLLLPATLAWRATRAGQWWRAGVWMGLCASLKLFFLLFLLGWLLARRWSALAGATAGFTLALAAGLFAYGSGPYVEWMGTLRIVGWWWLPMNASWHGAVSRVLAGSASVQPVVSAPHLVMPIATAGAALVCGVSLWLTRNLQGDPGRRDVWFLVLLLGAILASPLGWVYYLPLALGPLIAVAWQRLWTRVDTRVVAAVMLVAAGLYVPLEQAASGQPSAVATLTLASVYCWATVALWVGALALARRLAC